MGASAALGLLALWISRMSGVSAPMAGTLVFLMCMGCGMGTVVGVYALEHWRTYRWQGPLVATIAYVVALAVSLGDLSLNDMQVSGVLLLKLVLAGALPAAFMAYLTSYVIARICRSDSIVDVVGRTETNTPRE